MIPGQRLAAPPATAAPGKPEGEPARVSSLRMRLIEEHPFWGYLLMQVKILPAPGLSAIAATDCLERIWYNPRYTCHLDLKQLGFVLAHELGHHVYATMQRERGRDRHLWNCATDYAINRIVSRLVDPAVLYPPQALYRLPNAVIPGLGKVEILLDKRFDGLAAELIYEELVVDAAGLPGGGTVAVDLGEGGKLPTVHDHGGGIDVHLPGKLSAADRDALADRVRAAVEFWEANDRRGDVPGDVARAFDPGRSRVPWPRVLRAFVSRAQQRAELDPRRPSRRWFEAGAVVPSWSTDEQVGLVVVALDTSGSMNRAQLSAACAEIRAIAREVADLRLVVADAEVQTTVGLDELEKWLARGEARGGGGTSHLPVFEWVKQQGLKPDCFIGLTDLYSEFPPRRPPYPVAWVVPRPHGAAPFGQVIVVE